MLFSIRSRVRQQSLVRNGLLSFHARASHEVIGAPRRIPTVPARSRQLHLTTVARLLQQLPRGGLSWIFTRVDPSTRQLQQDLLWPWAELLHQEHGLACGQRQNTDTARLLLDLELGFCTIGKYKRLAGNAAVTGEHVRLHPLLPGLNGQEHPSFLLRFYHMLSGHCFLPSLHRPQTGSFSHSLRNPWVYQRSVLKWHRCED